MFCVVVKVSVLGLVGMGEVGGYSVGSNLGFQSKTFLFLLLFLFFRLFCFF